MVETWWRLKNFKISKCRITNLANLEHPSNARFNIGFNSTFNIGPNSLCCLVMLTSLEWYEWRLIRFSIILDCTPPPCLTLTLSLIPTVANHLRPWSLPLLPTLYCLLFPVTFFLRSRNQHYCYTVYYKCLSGYTVVGTTLQRPQIDYLFFFSFFLAFIF